MWPELSFTLPGLRFPETYNASTMLDAAIAEGFGDKPAVYSAEGTTSYSALLAQVNRIANVLTGEMALATGNRVLIHAPNCLTTLAIWWAVLRAGGVAVATMPMLRAGELETIIDKAKISHAFVEAGLETEFEAARQSSPTLEAIHGFRRWQPA